MPQYRIRNYFLRLIAVWLALAGLFAAEQHGVVKSGGLPVPGATVTATMDNKKVVTTTDDQGVYSFPDLDEGVWKMTVELLGFETVTRDIGVSPEAPSPSWDLKLMSAADLTTALAAKATAVAAAAAPAPAPAAPAVAVGAPAAAPTTAATTPTPAAPAAAPSATPTGNGRGGTQAAQNGRGRNQNQTAAAGRGGQGTAANGRGGQGTAANGGRPSLLGAYQEVGVNQSAESSAFNTEGNISSEQSAQLSQSADQAFVVQGSQSTAMGMGGNPDFGGGFGGRGGDFGGGPGGGFGGEAGGMGMGMPGAGGADAAGAGGAGGGAGGGGGVGGGGGGRGGGGGGIGGGGGRGGGGGMPGGGGPGGGGFGGGRGGAGGAAFAGGRGGRGGFQGRPGAMAFGNNRRNPRQMYTGSLNINEANSILDAKTFSLSGQDISKPYMNRTNVTGNVGGPFKIPKLLDGSKGQFQINFTVGRSRNGQLSGNGVPTTMPSGPERLGDFAGVPGTNGQTAVIYDPTNNAPFAGNIIPTTRINPIATQLMKFYPYPNLPGLTRNYEAPSTPVTSTNTLNSRVNQTINAKNRIMVNAAWQGTNGRSPNSLLLTDPFNNNSPIIDTSNGNGVNAGTTWSHNFTTRLINSLAFTFSRQKTVASPYFSGLQNIEGPQYLNIPGVATDSLNWGPPSVGFTNYGGLSDITARLQQAQTSSATESLMWIHAKHTFTFGGGFRRQQWDTQNNSNPRGSFSFNGDATSQYVNGKPVPNTGLDLADFMLGVPDTAAVQCAGGGATNLCNGDPAYYFRGDVISAYITDDFRVSQRFSLSFGARWDYQTPVNELHNQMVNMAFGPEFSSYVAALPGQTNPYTSQKFSSALVNSDPHNISPRVGLAWKPSAKKSTVIRAGYGVSYNTSAYSNMAMRLSQQPPLARSLNLNILNNYPLLQDGGITMANAFSLASTLGSNLSSNTYAINPDYKIGYAQTWNLAIQQNLPYSFQSTLTYTGVKGTDLDRTYQPWVSPPGSTLPSFLYPNGVGEQPNYAPGYTYETYGANSIYNGLSGQLLRRFSGGLSVSTTYTFRKYLGEYEPDMDWENFRLNRGPMVGPNQLAITGSYSTGQGMRGAGLLTGWKGHLVKDWTIQSGFTLASGNPITPSCAGNACVAVGSNGLSSRPEYTGVPVGPVEPGQYFNTAAFSQVIPAGQWGNAAPGSIAGPQIFNLSASAARVFRFGERHSMEIQLVTTNALNHVTITGWDTQVGSQQFGQATAVNGMRTVTASMRFRF